MQARRSFRHSFVTIQHSQSRVAWQARNARDRDEIFLIRTWAVSTQGRGPAGDRSERSSGRKGGCSACRAVMAGQHPGYALAFSPNQAARRRAGRPGVAMRAANKRSMHKHDTSSSASGLFAACTVEAFRRASLPAAQISAAALAAQWPESLRDCRALAAETGEAVATAEPVVFWLCLEPEVLPSLDPGFSTRPLEQKTEELRRILERELTRQAEPGLSVALRVIAARFSPAVLEAAARRACLRTLRGCGVAGVPSGLCRGERALRFSRRRGRSDSRIYASASGAKAGPCVPRKRARHLAVRCGRLQV